MRYLTSEISGMFPDKQFHNKIAAQKSSAKITLILLMFHRMFLDVVTKRPQSQVVKVQDQLNHIFMERTVAPV